MKKLLLAVVFLFFILLASSAFPLDISRHVSGSWFNPDQSGHGLSVEVLSDTRTLFYWYVYTPDGKPTFLVADGANSGDTVSATVYHQTGMVWGEFNPSAVDRTVWGTASLKLNSAKELILSYESTHDDSSIPNGSGEIQMVKLASIQSLQGHETPSAGIYLGMVENDIDDGEYPMTVLLTPQMNWVGFAEDSNATFGTYSLVGQDMSVNVSAFSADPQDPFSFSLHGGGQLDPEYRMYLTFSGQGMEGEVDGDFISADALYRRGVALDIHAGSHMAEEMVSGATGWSDVWPSGPTTFRFNGFMDPPLGGCSYEGTITIPDAAFNQFEVNLTTSGCGDTDGSEEYSGAGYQADVESLNDTRGLWLITTNSERPFVLWLTSMF
ncbi:MAG: hypothetical protein KJN69_01510 [Gammaproteobacteria bacterium]|nr:hypothetical protein [Gammaproteobacteria bacterium]